MAPTGFVLLYDEDTQQNTPSQFVHRRELCRVLSSVLVCFIVVSIITPNETQFKFFSPFVAHYVVYEAN